MKKFCFILRHPRISLRGFTLMELLILVALFGLLSGGLFLGYRSQLSKTYDSKRKTDLDTYAKAFEEYFNDHACYPTQSEWNNAQCGSSTSFLSSYMKQISCDPQRHVKYVYITTDVFNAPCDGACGDCAGYYLYTSLSNLGDPAIASSGCLTEGDCAYTDESGSKVNYRVASGNPLASASRTIPGNNLDSSRLFVFGPSPTTRPGFHITPAPTPPPVESPVEKNVMVIDFNPVFETHGGKTLRTLKGWADPVGLERQFIEDIATASGQYLKYTVVARETADLIPPKADGFLYGDLTYLDVLNNVTGAYQPDAPADYLMILDEYDICQKVNNGTVDEVWFWGGPWFGFYQTVMAGPQAYYSGAPPLTDTSCTNNILISGFRYDQDLTAMIENFGNRTEHILSDVFGEYATKNGEPVSGWGKFTKTDIWFPGESACGRISHTPNALNEKDYSSVRQVKNYCDDWLTYPDLRDSFKLITCSKWGCSKYGYFLWWLSHLPKTGGSSGGFLNNWWRYFILDY